MAITKAAANKKYDELRKKLKNGDITKEAFKTASTRIYNMYHGDANKATRNTAPARRSTSSSSSSPSPRQGTREDAQRRLLSSSSGTRGESLPSNPQLKTQPKPKSTKHKGGTRSSPNRKKPLARRSPTSNRRTNRRGRRI